MTIYKLGTLKTKYLKQTIYALCYGSSITTLSKKKNLSIRRIKKIEKLLPLLVQLKREIVIINN